MEQKRFSIFAERFSELRGEKTQGEFAEFLGISRPTVGFYENGTRIPDALVLRQIAERCRVSSDWLIGLSDVKSFDGTLQLVCNYTKLSEGAINSILELYRVEKYLDNDYAVSMAQALSMIIEQPCFEPMMEDMQKYYDALYHTALGDGTYGDSLDDPETVALLNALREKCGKHLHVLPQNEVPYYYKNSASDLWGMLAEESGEEFQQEVRTRYNMQAARK